MASSSKKGRGRPAYRPSQVLAAKESILEASMALLDERGADVPVEEILQAAGISRATFYKYFASKTALQEALLEFAVGKQLIAVQKATSSSDNALARIEAGLDAFLQFHAERPRAYRLIISWSLSPDTTLYAIRSRLVQAAADILAIEVERNRSAPLDPLVYLILVGAVENASIRLLEGGSPIDPDEFERTKAVLMRIVGATLGNTETELPSRPLSVADET